MIAVSTLSSRFIGFALLLVERFHRIQAPSFEVTMGSEDRKICDYHDVLLRQSDLELLKDGQWLNDQLIAFYLEYLRQEKFAEVKTELLILDPSAAFMLTAVAPEEVPMLLGSLGAPEKQMVLFHNFDRSKTPGFVAHAYKLLQMCPGAAPGFFHCDSFSNSNLTAAKRLLPAAKHLVGAMLTPSCTPPSNPPRDTKADLQSARVPQQQNCCDCGVFALAFADRMAGLCASATGPSHTAATEASESEQKQLQELVEQSVSTASQGVVSKMRQSIRLLVQERSQEPR